MPKKKKSSKSRSTHKQDEFTKIDRILDNEHKKILKAADKLYDECFKHWQTEERMYREGLNRLPDGHPNISKGWKEHTKHHKDFLAQIKSLRGKIIKHINTDDVRDFHWTSY